MNRFYSALCAFLLCISLLDISVPLQAQHVTFSEDFNTSKEYGDMPDGWTAWENSGGAGGPYGSAWGASKDWDWSSNWYMYSPPEVGIVGMKDEDWIITPQITPQENDFFICDCFRGGADEVADIFEFRISTTTNDAPDAFTDVLASYTAAEMPYFDGRVSLDLSAYVGVPVYIAIVHIADNGTDDPEVLSNYLIVDNVQVRNIQEAFVLDAVFRQATSPPRPPALLTDPVTIAGSLGFIVAGDNGVANISSITLSMAGTTDMSLLKEVIVYYSDWSLITDDEILNGEPPFGSVQNPGETITITGSRDLPLGMEPTLWFRFVLDDTREVSYPYPKIDVSVENFVINGVEQEPGVKTYFGAMDVVSDHVSNDNLADATELSATPARYGSSTMRATHEAEYDTPKAYCHNGGYSPNIHSVWWYFVAPSDGLVTADLADSHFNTILSFFDEDLNPVACNDNMTASTDQSRIEDYRIMKGEKIYVRVSDLGGWGPNQWDVSGVVVMDFSFSVLTGVAEDGGLSSMTLHPNPASQNVSLDITILRPTEVMIDVRDVMGRSRHAQQERFSSTGKHTVAMDVSALPAGTYVVSVQRGEYLESRKLSIIK
jgi:hypothetical protein